MPSGRAAKIHTLSWISAGNRRKGWKVGDIDLAFKCLFPRSSGMICLDRGLSIEVVLVNPAFVLAKINQYVGHRE